MDDPNNKIQNQDPVSVKTGGAESEPVQASSENTANSEIIEQVQETEQSPELSREVREAGVSVVSDDKPVIHPTAKDGGLDHSIPDVVDQGYKIQLTPEEAQKDKVNGKVNEATSWRALIAIKEFAKGLLGINQPQEAN
jgi:hypothetical protein